MTSLCGLHTIGKSLYHLTRTGYSILFIHLNNLCLRLLLVAAVHLCHYGLGEVEECLTGDCLGMACCRLSLVAVLTDALHERNLGEQRGFCWFSSKKLARRFLPIINIVTPFSGRTKKSA